MSKEGFPSSNKIPTPDTEHGLFGEKFKNENEFKNFLLTIKTIPADTDTVLGIPREYVSSIDAYKIYKSSFKKEALAPHSISYRLRNIKETDFPDDFLVDPTKEKYEPKYFINRLNEELLKKIFMPAIVGENKIETEYLQRQDAQAFREFHGGDDIPNEVNDDE